MKAAAAAGRVRVSPLDVHQLLRLTKFPQSEPFWGKFKSRRFDDPAQIFGTTYAAPTMDVAFAETILRTKGHFIGNEWIVDESMIDERFVVRFQRPIRPVLQLLNLTGSNLKALGLNNDLCATDDYLESMTISATVHAQLPDVDGLLYVSRQMNSGLAVVLYERSAVAMAPDVTPLKKHAAYGDLLQSFNVSILPGARGQPPT